jgi:hypothetical protein
MNSHPAAAVVSLPYSSFHSCLIRHGGVWRGAKCRVLPLVVVGEEASSLRKQGLIHRGNAVWLLRSKVGMLAFVIVHVEKTAVGAVVDAVNPCPCERRGFAHNVQALLVFIPSMSGQMVGLQETITNAKPGRLGGRLSHRQLSLHSDRSIRSNRTRRPFP